MSKRLAAVCTALALTAAGCGLGSPDEGAEVVTEDSVVENTTETTMASETPEAPAETDSTEPDTASTDGDDGAAAGDGSTDSGGQSAGGNTIGINGTSINLGDSILAGTLNPTADTSSARFEATIELVGSPDSELPGALSMSFQGAYDLDANASDITIDFGDIFAAAIESDPNADEFGLFADFFEDPIRVITIGDTSYVQWGLLNLFAGADTNGDVWLETPADESEDLASTFAGGFVGGESPTEFLDDLRDANAVVEEVGREDVQGTPTTHYRALVDTEALAETMTPEERAEFESSFGGAGSEFPMDFWVGDDGLLYRYVIAITDPALLEDSDGLESLSISYEIFDYGQDVGIVPPPADDIISDDELGGFGFGD